MAKSFDEYEDLNQRIRLVNPYMGIICISKYTQESNGQYCDLPGCDIDRKRMINLFKNIYKFDENRLFINDETGIVDKDEFNSSLHDIRHKINKDFQKYNKLNKNKILNDEKNDDNIIFN